MSRKRKNKPPIRQRIFGEYIFNSVGLHWWKCGRLELWAWSGYMFGVWTKTWVFEYKGVIVEELFAHEWEKPFTTLGNKLAAGGFDKSMLRIDKGGDTAVCGFVEIKEKPSRSLGHTHYFHEDHIGDRVLVRVMKIKKPKPKSENHKKQ